jgi:hypothetical protein
MTLCRPWACPHGAADSPLAYTRYLDGAWHLLVVCGSAPVGARDLMGAEADGIALVTMRADG